MELKGNLAEGFNLSGSKDGKETHSLVNSTAIKDRYGFKEEQQYIDYIEDNMDTVLKFFCYV